MNAHKPAAPLSLSLPQDLKANVQNLKQEQKKWLHDPLSEFLRWRDRETSFRSNFPSPTDELCRPLNCKKHELCLLEDANTAVCISKHDLHRAK